MLKGIGRVVAGKRGDDDDDADLQLTASFALRIDGMNACALDVCVEMNFLVGV